MEPLERMKRIAEIMAKGTKATDAEKAEVKKLLDEQMAWARANPAKAMEAQRAFELSKKTPEAMKAEYEAAKTEAAAKDVYDPLYYQGLLRADPIKAAEYKAKFDTRTREEKIADAGSGSYGVENIRTALTPQPEPKPVVEPMAEAAPDPSIEYPMTETTPAPEAPKPEAPAPEAPKPEAPAPEAPPSEATTVDVDSGVKEEAKAIATEKKPGWKDKIKDLGTKYGVPMLEIFQAIAHQRSGAGGDTILDKKYQEKLEAKQREYMENLEKQREEREAAQYEKRIAAERAWQEQQAAANRAADVAARREELSSREKLLQMQLAAQKGAAAVGGSAPIIPQ